MRFLTVTMLLTAGLIHANAYPLQFAPSGHVLYVSGYTVGAAGVSGVCDYVHITSGSGRVPRRFYTYYKGACTWDLFGRLTSATFVQTPSAPVPTPPAPILVNGTTITYATDAEGDTTGQTTHIA